MRNDFSNLLCGTWGSVSVRYAFLSELALGETLRSLGEKFCCRTCERGLESLDVDRRSVHRARLFSGLIRILLGFLVFLIFVPGLDCSMLINSKFLIEL